jgi:hypothetical protein
MTPDYKCIVCGATVLEAECPNCSGIEGYTQCDERCNDGFIDDYFECQACGEVFHVSELMADDEVRELIAEALIDDYTEKILGSDGSN